MPHTLYILDLDRTLFNTAHFAGDIIDTVVSQFGLDADQFQDSRINYTQPNEMGYDFFKHATTAANQPVEAVMEALAKHLGRTDYTYDDVAPWLASLQDSNAQIVTVGQPNYQTLKLSYAPALKPYSLQIVGQNKGLLLRNTLTNSGDSQLKLVEEADTIVVIDDNPRTFFELGEQPNVKPFYVSRSGEKYANQPVPAHVTTITSLTDLL